MLMLMVCVCVCVGWVWFIIVQRHDMVMVRAQNVLLNSTIIITPCFCTSHCHCKLLSWQPRCPQVGVVVVWAVVPSADSS
jgi:hypothetical protein